MASTEGQINLAVAYENDRLLKWVLTAIDMGHLDVINCCADSCDHKARQECVDRILAIYNGESDPTDETPDGAEQEASGLRCF